MAAGREQRTGPPPVLLALPFPRASLLWLLVRLWLGYQWANAGYQKIWGAERALFWFGGGTGVKGFASAGISGSTADARSGASYGRWAAFLHDLSSRVPPGSRSSSRSGAARGPS